MEDVLEEWRSSMRAYGKGSLNKAGQTPTQILSAVSLTVGEGDHWAIANLIMDEMISSERQ